MKRYAVIALASLMLTGCVKNLDNIPSRALIVEQGTEWAEEKLVGYTPDALREVWGEPDGQLSGLWGDVWFVDEDHTARVTVYYDADGSVEHVRLDTAPGLKPVLGSATEPDTDYLEILDSPPKLKVVCGGEELQTVSCGFTWVTECGILCADAPTSVQMKEQMNRLETVEKLVVLEFEVPPDVWHIQAWEENTEGDETPGERVSVCQRDAIELLPGGYIYEVSAEWGDGENYGGTGTYAFHIEKLYPGKE